MNTEKKGSTLEHLNTSDTQNIYLYKNKKRPETAAGMYHHFWYNQQSDYHAHDSYEIFVVTEGTVKHNYGGIIEFLTPGTLVLIFPGEYHQILRNEKDKSTHFNLVISDSIFNEICSSMGSDVCHLFSHSSKRTIYHMKDVEFDYFMYLAGLILSSQGQQTNVILRTIATVLISQFYNSYDHNLAYPSWLEDLLAKLRNPAYFLQPVSDLYNLAPYSRSVMTKKFKEYMNETLVSYVTKQKINYACTLLRSSNQSILDIAEATRYDSLSHFNHAFKRYVGLTPSDYRKKYNIASLGK